MCSPNQWRTQNQTTPRATFVATVDTVCYTSYSTLQYSLFVIVTTRAMARLALGLDPPLVYKILQRMDLLISLFFLGRIQFI